MTHHDGARLDDLIAHLGDGDSKDLFRTLWQRGMQELIDAALTATSAPSSTNAPTLGPISETAAGAAHCRRRLATSSCYPEAAGGVVLPELVGAAPPGRPSVVGGDHDRVHHRHLNSEGRRSRARTRV